MNPGEGDLLEAVARLIIAAGEKVEALREVIQADQEEIAGLKLRLHRVREILDGVQGEQRPDGQIAAIRRVLG